MRTIQSLMLTFVLLSVPLFPWTQAIGAGAPSTEALTMESHEFSAEELTTEAHGPSDRTGTIEGHVSSVDPQNILFADDFLADSLGSVPRAWHVQGTDGSVEVVEDASLDSGKALRIVADGARLSKIEVASPWWDSLDDDPTTIAVEHKMYWLKGRNIDLYVQTPSGQALSWYVPRSGELLFDGESYGQFQPGWNHLRFFINRVTNEAYMYVNDMDRPRVGPVSLRSPVASWRGDRPGRFFIRLTRRDDDPTTALFGDFAVWVVDDDVTDRLGLVRGSVWVGDRPLRPEITFPMESATVEKVRVPLRVEEREGIARRAQPVTSGVPMPEGHLWDPAQVRLVDGENRPIPLQKTVLSRWPDGSIRWLLLDFQADVSPRDERIFYLEYGSSITDTTGHPVVVTEDDDEVVIDTGRLNVVLGKRAPLLRRIEVDGGEWRGVAQPELRIEGSGGIDLATSEAPYELVVEEAGSERAVVRVAGELHKRIAGDTLNFAYDMRWHFYRDHDVVRIDPTITNLMGAHVIQSKHTDIDAVSLHFPKWMTGDGVTFHIGADGTPVLGHGEAVVVMQPRSGRFHIEADGEEIYTGRHAPGWAMFQTDERTIGVGVRHFREQFPKSIRVSDEGDLTIDLWAPGTGTLTMGGGEAKRHELYVSFGPVGALGKKDASRMIRSMLYPLRAAASPAWYSTTEAFGRPFFLVDEKALPLYDEHVAIYEEFVKIGYDTIVQNRERLQEYGWRHFGDWSTTWDVDGWGNAEYDLAYTYFRQFARTGDLRYLHLAETVIRHWMDVDMIWASNDVDWVGGGHSHTSHHRGYAGEHHTWNQGMLDYYHLTGDRRALEAARAVGDFFARLALVQPDRHRPRLALNEQRDVNPRSPGWALIALTAVYESTLDPYYLKAAEAVVDILEEWQEEDGQWRYLIPDREVKGTTVATKAFMTGIVLAALGDYHRVTKDTRAADMLVKGLTFLTDELWVESTQSYPYIDHPQHPPGTDDIWNMIFLDGYAYGYEITADPKFLDVAMKGFRSSIRAQAGKLRSNAGQRVAITLRNTPHALATLVQPIKEFAVTGPRHTLIGREQSATVRLSLVRLHDGGRDVGRLIADTLPDGMHMRPEVIEYDLKEGDQRARADFDLHIDKTVAPGRYTVVLTDPDRFDRSVNISVEVPGWTVSDRFRPPISDAFFGHLSFQMAEEVSPGWVHDTGQSDLFFGDEERLKLVSDSEEYLVYDAPGLFDFALTIYAPTSDTDHVADRVEVWVKGYEDDWGLVSTNIVWETRVDQPMAKGTITPEERMFRGDVQLKIVVTPGVRDESFQIGRFDMSGWK